MGSRVDWKPLASEDVQRTNYQLSLISFFNQLFYVFMQSTCRKMKKIPDTVWMTMIQQYNKNSGKDGKQQGMQVRNEFQSQACPWPSTHSDESISGRTAHYSLNCQRKCCKMLALNSVSISAGNIYLIFSLCVNPFGKLWYFREDNLCREKLGLELKHLCHCEFNLQIYFPVYSICTVLVIQVQKRKYIPWLLQMRQHQTFSKSWNILNPV